MRQLVILGAGLDTIRGGPIPKPDILFARANSLDIPWLSLRPLLQ